ncbi:unnamed protein product [Closterium sp. Naga37s-1]|nr:unnamed protein product [Closterium sp. Naga37s-1]
MGGSITNHTLLPLVKLGIARKNRSALQSDMQLVKHSREEREALPNVRQAPLPPDKGPSRYPAQATTPPAGQEHHPEYQEKESGDDTGAPVADAAGGEDAVAAPPGPLHRPEGQQKPQEPLEDPCAAEKEATAGSAQRGPAEEEEPRPPRQVEAGEQPGTTWTAPAAAEGPEGRPTSAAAAARNSGRKTQTAPSTTPRAAPPTGKATGPPARTKAAAATKKRPATATVEVAEAAPVAASEAPLAPETAEPEPGIAPTVGQETETAGEGGGGGRTDPGPLDVDESARGETDKSAHEVQTNRRVPKKSRRQKPRPQQHQRRLGEGLAPARPGPLVGWAHQENPPMAVAEAEGGADQLSPRLERATETAEDEAEAQEERESAAEDAEERRAAARRGRHQGGTSRQQALQEQANRRAEGRPPQIAALGAAARGARGRGRGREGGLGNLVRAVAREKARSGDRRERHGRPERTGTRQNAHPTTGEDEGSDGEYIESEEGDSEDISLEAEEGILNTGAIQGQRSARNAQPAQAAESSAQVGARAANRERSASDIAEDEATR